MAAEVTCPNCSKSFKLDDAGYAEIQRQVRNAEFNSDVEARLATRDAEHQAKLAEQQLEFTGQLEILRTRLTGEKEVLQKEVELLRNFRAAQSTKMVGESLEKHCKSEYQSRLAQLLPRATFDKDNEVSGAGTKGDFIFRESDEDGMEFVSIMFEMKNESATSTTKQRNEQFFKKLHEDRQNKGCEYAVLVSMLEQDNEAYNTGIIEVSKPEYPKMYVVRPQFFAVIIVLLRNAALSSLDYKRELAALRDQQIDVINFESKLQEFQKGMRHNYGLASDKFKKAIDEIDRSIKALEKVKDALEGADTNLRRATKTAEGITIRKLTQNSPALRDAFKEVTKVIPTPRDEENLSDTEVASGETDDVDVQND